jgi:hypothetical protein
MATAPMKIEVTGLTGDAALRTRVVERMQHALGQLSVAPVSAHVGFFDENGPKGGVDTRCAVTVALPYHPGVRVEHLAETPRLAFDVTFEVLERQLHTYAERQRESRRRPKKYFAAKRLFQ